MTLFDFLKNKKPGSNGDFKNSEEAELNGVPTGEYYYDDEGDNLTFSQLSN